MSFSIINTEYLDGENVYDWISKDFINRQARQTLFSIETDDYDVMADVTVGLLENEFGIFIRQAKATVRYRNEDLFITRALPDEGNWYYVRNYLAPQAKTFTVEIDGRPINTGRIDGDRLYFGQINTTANFFETIDVTIETGFPKGDVPAVFKKVFAMVYVDVLVSRSARDPINNTTGVKISPVIQSLIRSCYNYKAK